MKIVKTELDGVLLLQPTVHEDNRGYFFELYRQQPYQKAGMPPDFVQDNVSFSHKGVIRGLHYQHPNGQAKLIQVLTGAVFDVAVDIRKGSPAFGKWFGTVISAENRHQVFLPAGFAHGFCVVSQHAVLVYKCSDYYHPDSDCGINWTDPAIDIEWPEKNPMLSDKDARLPNLDEIAPENLPEYKKQV